MNTINMNAIGNVFDFQESDGKNLGKEIEGMEWVRISEKKIGKGKGKTIAAISLPAIGTDLQPLFADALNTTRKEMLTMAFRAGQRQMSEDESDASAVHNYYAAQVFSVDAIAGWFDTEMGVYLAMNVCAAKGWKDEELTGEQQTYINTKLASYKAAFLECGSKFPKLSPEQKKELIRVIGINELSGGIVDRIRCKLEVKESVEEALGF